MAALQGKVSDGLNPGRSRMEHPNFSCCSVQWEAVSVCLSSGSFRVGFDGRTTRT